MLIPQTREKHLLFLLSFTFASRFFVGRRGDLLRMTGLGDGESHRPTHSGEGVRRRIEKTT